MNMGLLFWRISTFQQGRLLIKEVSRISRVCYGMFYCKMFSGSFHRGSINMSLYAGITTVDVCFISVLGTERDDVDRWSRATLRRCFRFV